MGTAERPGARANTRIMPAKQRPTALAGARLRRVIEELAGLRIAVGTENVREEFSFMEASREVKSRSRRVTRGGVDGDPGNLRALGTLAKNERQVNVETEGMQAFRRPLPRARLPESGRRVQAGGGRTKLILDLGH